MAIKQYLERIGGPQILYRVQNYKKDRGLPQSFTPASKQEKEKLADELRRAVFEKSSDEFFTFISDLAWYPIEDQDVKLASFVVISLDKNRGKKVFEKELIKSKKIRKQMLAYVSKTLKPFLKKLMKSDLVLGCVLRGDLINPKRHPTKFSDIDIDIITSFPSNDKKSKQKLLSLLKQSPCSASYDYYEFYKKSFYGSEKPLVRKKSKYKAEYSLLSLPEMERLYIVFTAILKQKGKILSTYDYETFKWAKILFQKQKAGRKYISMILKLAAT